jgi:hypothetical protein
MACCIITVTAIQAEVLEIRQGGSPYRSLALGIPFIIHHQARLKPLLFILRHVAPLPAMSCRQEITITCHTCQVRSYCWRISVYMDKRLGWWMLLPRTRHPGCLRKAVACLIISTKVCRYVCIMFPFKSILVLVWCLQAIASSCSY